MLSIQSRKNKLWKLFGNGSRKRGKWDEITPLNLSDINSNNGIIMNNIVFICVWVNNNTKRDKDKK